MTEALSSIRKLMITIQLMLKKSIWNYVRRRTKEPRKKILETVKSGTRSNYYIHNTYISPLQIWINTKSSCQSIWRPYWNKCASSCNKWRKEYSSGWWNGFKLSSRQASFGHLLYKQFIKLSLDYNVVRSSDYLKASLMPTRLSVKTYYKRSFKKKCNTFCKDCNLSFVLYWKLFPGALR